MVEPETIRRRLTVLRDALADLRRYRAMHDLDTLRADRDVQHMVLHALYVAAQAAIDLALHAGADVEQAASATYQQSFDALVAAKRLEPQLAQRLKGWAGLRNVLAHHYVSIDYARIHATLQHELGDLDTFAAIVATWLR